MVNVEQGVVALVAMYSGVKPEEVKLDSQLVGGLGMDSLDIIELVMAIEEEFSIEVDDADSEKWSTVSDAVATVTKEMA